MRYCMLYQLIKLLKNGRLQQRVFQISKMRCSSVQNVDANFFFFFWNANFADLSSRLLQQVYFPHYRLLHLHKPFTTAFFFREEINSSTYIYNGKFSRRESDKIELSYYDLLFSLRSWQVEEVYCWGGSFSNTNTVFCHAKNLVCTLVPFENQTSNLGI